MPADAVDVSKETTQVLDATQTLLTLETKLLLLEARIVLLEKQSIEASQTVPAKQAEVPFYGSNRRIKRSDTK